MSTREALDPSIIYRDIVQVMSDAVYVHRHGTILWCNGAAERMFGATAECGLVGKLAWELIGNLDRERVVTRYEKLGPPDRPNLVHVVRRRLDGSEFPTEAYGASIEWDGEPATMMIIRDLSEKIELERELAEVSTRELDFAETSPDAILVHRYGTIVFANPAACTMYRATNSADLIGRDILELVHPEARAEIRNIWCKASRDIDEKPIEIRRLRLDGSEFVGDGRQRLITWKGEAAILVVVRDATPRIVAQEALKRSEARHRELLDRLPDAVFAHVDGHIHYANQAAVDQYRAASVDDLIGRNMVDLVHPDERANLRENWKKADASAPNFVATRRRLRLDGTVFEGEARRIGDSWSSEPGYIVVIQDVTERLEAERALRESEQRYRAIAEVCPVPIFVHVSGRIVYANPAACETFASESANDSTLIGHAVRDLVHPDDRALFSDLARHVNLGDRLAPRDARFISADGCEMVCEALGCGYIWNNAPAKLLIVRDVSERKRTEIRLRRAQQEAEHANEMKSRFFARMSHELRTPLNAILGFSEVIEGELFGAIDNEKYVDYASDIQTSGRHLLSLIDDLLDLSKVESGRYELRESDFDLAAQLRESLHMIAPLAARKRLAVTGNIPDEQCFVCAGEREVRQIIANLLSNAVKFTPDGGKIDVSLDFSSPGDIVVEIVDNGIGIAAPDLSKLFTDYTQVGDPFESTDQKGTGLGLALCRQFAELHDGEIRLDSVPGGGTTATLVLPAWRRLAVRENRTGTIPA